MSNHALTGRGDGASAEVTVILGDDQTGIRAGVRQALEARGVRVLAEAGTAVEAVAAAVRHKPAVCLLSVHLPGSGITAAEQINEAFPGTKIVMLTGSDRDEDLFAAILAGADGYLLKTTSPLRLPDAVLGVLSGEAAIPRRLVARLIQDYRSRGRPKVLRVPGSGEPIVLTAREFEVITRLRDGETTAVIARDLRIPEVTVRRHISSLEHKLGAPNRPAALAMVESAEIDVLSERP
jgi:DNA-binding NarL/FixJ family response regulator